MRQGGSGLTAQMLAAFEWAGPGCHVVVLSDTVRGIRRLAWTRSGVKKLAPLRDGELLLVIQHGARLLRDNGFTAWSSCAVHKAQWMSHNRLTRRLGLLDGNFLGIMVPQGFETLRGMPDQMFFVGLSCWLWKENHSFVRYSMLSCDHPYRLPGGQATRFPTEAGRRQQENQTIRRLSLSYPGLISFEATPGHSIKRMQYKFARKGPGPLVMEAVTKSAMSIAARDVLRAASGAARMRKMRRRKAFRRDRARQAGRPATSVPVESTLEATTKKKPRSA